ncbi:MAG: phage shock protein A [Gammaproteobacteria bacterium]|jgi:phage shock protein A
MGLFKRISATVSATVGDAVSAMENHDAVVDASLHDMRRASAKAKARHNRVSNDGARLRRKAAEFRANESRWIDRATQYADDDEEKALECLRRKNDCQRLATSCEETVRQHAELESRLKITIEKIDKRYQDLDQTRTMMRTRQSAADAFRTSEFLCGSNNFLNVDDTVERGEARITETEMGIGNDIEPNHFEKEFLDDEQRIALQIELDELKQSE